MTTFGDLYLHPDDLVYESDIISFHRRDWRIVRFDEMTCRYCIPFYDIDKLREKDEGVIFERIDEILKHI